MPAYLPHHDTVFTTPNAATGKLNLIRLPDHRVEESTPCIYLDKVFVHAGDGYVHAVK